MEALVAARSLVVERFPGALAAFLAGSASRGTATALSDLDIVVVLGGRPAPYRETVRFASWPVELFVHDEASLRYWYDLEASNFRPVLAHMVATGVVLLDAGAATRLQEAATAQLDAGPAPLAKAELLLRRYLLTDTLDDLISAADADERDAVAGAVLTQAAELFLLNRGHWLGRSKWLVRRLTGADPRVARDLMAAHRVAVGTGDTASLEGAAEAILDEVGGRLTEGYRAG